MEINNKYKRDYDYLKNKFDALNINCLDIVTENERLKQSQSDYHNELG